MIIRLLPYSIADGPHNMARDEVLLQTAIMGRASLRFYGWTEATLSLGYFQPWRVRLADAGLASLPCVRRPTGGATLVHHHELTYALALPQAAAESRSTWMRDMHRIIARALQKLGVDRIQSHNSLARRVAMTDFLCFQQPTPGDLLCGPHKLLGSSQRRHRHALLQHGALLLAQSPFTPALPGIKELTGVELATGPLIEAITDAFQEDAGMGFERQDWTADEQTMIERLEMEKYALPHWNEKR